MSIEERRRPSTWVVALIALIIGAALPAFLLARQQNDGGSKSPPSPAPQGFGPKSMSPASSPITTQCDADTLMIETRVNRSGEVVLITSSLDYRFDVDQRPACFTDTTVKATLLDENGKPLEIDGNPATFNLSGTLPIERPWRSWSWSNWCNAFTRGSVRIEAQNLKDEDDLTQSPSCEDRKRRSNFGLSGH